MWLLIWNVFLTHPNNSPTIVRIICVWLHTKFSADIHCVDAFHMPIPCLISCNLAWKVIWLGMPLHSFHVDWTKEFPYHSFFCRKARQLGTFRRKLSWIFSIIFFISVRRFHFYKWPLKFLPDCYILCM